jgi:hypothetical protein
MTLTTTTGITLMTMAMVFVQRTSSYAYYFGNTRRPLRLLSLSHTQSKFTHSAPSTFYLHNKRRPLLIYLYTHIHTHKRTQTWNSVAKIQLLSNYLLDYDDILFFDFSFLE